MKPPQENPDMSDNATRPVVAETASWYGTDPPLPKRGWRGSRKSDQRGQPAPRSAIHGATVTKEKDR